MEVGFLILAFIWTAIIGGLYQVYFDMTPGRSYLWGFLTPFIVGLAIWFIVMVIGWVCRLFKKGQSGQNGSDVGSAASQTNNPPRKFSARLKWEGPELMGSGGYRTVCAVSGDDILAQLITPNHKGKPYKIGSISADEQGSLHVFGNSGLEIGNVTGGRVIFDNSKVINHAIQTWKDVDTSRLLNKINVETVAEIHSSNIISTIGECNVIATVEGNTSLGAAAMIAMLYECDDSSPYHTFWSTNYFDREHQWSIRKREL